MRRISALNFVGGYRLKGPWARGSFAVDWRAKILRMTGHVHGNTILTYDLAAAGPPELFPEVSPVSEDWGWWPQQKQNAAGQYANGLWFDGEHWWAVCRAHYDTAPRGDMDVYRDDGLTWTVPLPQQKFSGFVKPQPGADLVSWPYFGCGGYESGQGTCSGPTLAVYDGTVLLEYADFNLESPGPNLEYWDHRAPRLPDYSIWRDEWLAWKPRVRNGKREGRWASDWLYGGGVILPGGLLCYFPWQGTGELRYDWNPPHFDQRTITFAESESKNRSCLLAYDTATMQCVEFDRVFNDFWGPVRGQEVDPQGRLWLAQGFGHGDAEVVIRVYEVA